jgi:hypothetical protein
MNADPERYVETWLSHIHALAEEIGPRGSTTDGERRASAYCEGVLVRLGLAPTVEPFTSARSIYSPYVLAQVPMLLAFLIYPLAGRISAALSALLVLVAVSSMILELSLRDNLLRRVVPQGPSQNVVATVPPAGEHRQDLVLIGHVDTARTAILFRSWRWIVVNQVFMAVMFVLGLLQVVLYFLGMVTQWPWIWPASIPYALCAVLLVAHHLHADRTPFSPGANDNATGAGLVLTLAQHLQAEPLDHTRVWLVNTGCEEVQHYGAADFFRRHRSDLHAPVAVAFEMLGCTGPAWLTREGVIVPFHADRELAALAEEVAHEHPEWGATATQVNGGNTEMADALLAGVPAITLSGTARYGDPVYYHQLQDTYDKMDPDVMGRAYAFVWAFIQALDVRGEALPGE